MASQDKFGKLKRIKQTPETSPEPPKTETSQSKRPSGRRRSDDYHTYNLTLPKPLYNRWLKLRTELQIQGKEHELSVLIEPVIAEWLDIQESKYLNT
jgi:hypothetical protein